jgi:hypothetical protein
MGQEVRNSLLVCGVEVECVIHPHELIFITHTYILSLPLSHTHTHTHTHSNMNKLEHDDQSCAHLLSLAECLHAKMELGITPDKSRMQRDEVACCLLANHSLEDFLRYDPRDHELPYSKHYCVKCGSFQQGKAKIGHQCAKCNTYLVKQLDYEALYEVCVSVCV